MNDIDLQLLEKLGIIVTDTEYTHNEMPETIQKHSRGEPVVTTRGTFYIDEDVFRPMCRLIKITDMICESKNPQIAEQFEHLVTMLFLTEDKNE